jgi:hypothetical protein
MPTRYVADPHKMRAMARSDMSQSCLYASTLVNNSAQREGPASCRR